MKRRNGTGGGNGVRPDRVAAESALATVDRALATGEANATHADERRLEELALALRAEAPRPSDDFARRMDARVTGGFRAARSSRRGAAGGVGSRLLRPLPALALAASLLVAVGVAASLYGGADEPLQTVEDPVAPAIAPEEGGGGGGGALRDVAPAEGESLGRGAVAGSSATTAERFLAPPTRQRDVLPGRENRRVERSAQIALAAPGDELQDVAAGIASVAERNGGVLTDSSLTTAEAGRGGGSFELQVPVDRLSATLAELSDLATVRSLTQAGDDLTVRFVRRGDSVEQLGRQLDELQADLAVAATDDEHDAIRTEIRDTRREIRAAERALDRVRERTAFATIGVTLVEGEERETGLGAALDDGVDLLEDALGIGIRALGILIPLAVLMAIAWWLAGLVRRRQRESALA